MHTLFVEAGIIGGIASFFSDKALEAFGAILLVFVGVLTKRYIVPLLKSAQARQTAEHVLTIADDVTDYFAEKFPTAHWSVWLDRAIDKIIEVTGVSRGPAERAAMAAISRKKEKIVSQQKIQAQT